MNKEVRDALEADRRYKILTFILSSKNVLGEATFFL